MKEYNSNNEFCKLTKSIPLRLFKVPKSTDIEDYLALKEFINK